MKILKTLGLLSNFLINICLRMKQKEKNETQPIRDNG